MSNLGLHVFAGEHGLKLECTSVGDRNVLERMQEKGYVLGGEQSGHMIFLDYATTGDGQLTALQVLALLKESGKKASEVFGSCARYPQVLINVPVASNDVKNGRHGQRRPLDRGARGGGAPGRAAAGCWCAPPGQRR